MANFQRYLARSPESDLWGIAVSAGGRQTSPAGAAYPPSDHPADHYFLWETGRMLGACQIVFITAGRGRFESRETGLVEVASGTAMVILPNVWHRYAPDPATGWTEQWIELHGEIIDRFCARRVLDPARSVVVIEQARMMGSLLDAIRQRLDGSAASAFDPLRAALGLQVLALVIGQTPPPAAARAITATVLRAEKRLAEMVDHPTSMPQLARELGVAYSYFRREFKKHTGLSPYQYVQDLRLGKARRLIGNSQENLEVVAERLGFASSFHLSAAFKKRYGQAPTKWRRGG